VRRRLAVDPLAALAVVVPVLVVLVLLLPVVDVDPARGVTISNSPFTDEGWNVLTARNLVVLGTPITDDWNLGLVNLPFTAIVAGVFRLFGVGIVQARLVDIACVTATVGLLGGGLQRPFGRTAAFVAALAYGTSTLVLFYGRLAYLEPMVALFLTAGTLTSLAVQSRHSGRWGIVGGIALALAVGTKSSAIPGVAGFLLVTTLYAVHRPVVRSWLVGSTATLGTLVAAWFALVWAPNRDAISRIVHQVYPRARDLSPLALIRRAGGYVLGRDDHVIAYLAPIGIAAIGGIAATWWARRSWSIATRVLLAGSAAGFVVGFATTVLVFGNVNRYIVSLVPWLAILTAPLTAVLVRRLTSREAWRNGSFAGRATATAVIGGFVILLAAEGLLHQLAWTSGATRNLVGVQAEVASILPPGSVVAGGYAPLLAMRAPVRTIVPCCGANPINGGDLYADAGARYWVDGNAPSWAASHKASWNARTPLVCLPWTRGNHPICVERLP
jgi:4-amino-4-deoxy-L-arabinose transferase-like glycosyltransferase